MNSNKKLTKKEVEELLSRGPFLNKDGDALDTEKVYLSLNKKMRNKKMSNENSRWPDTVAICVIWICLSVMFHSCGH